MRERYADEPRRGRSAGGRGRQAPSRKKKKKRPFLVRLGAGLYKLLVVCSAFIVVAYFAWPYLVPEPEVHEPAPPSAGDSDASAPAGPAAGQSAGGRQRRDQVWNFVLLGKDVGSGNTDSIIVVSYDVPNKKVGMISIPRDTAVDRSWRKNPKINGAFYGAGADTLKDEIYQTFGIPIDYYVLVDLKGFVALVDKLEGVDVDIPVNMNYDDPYQNLHIHLNKGFQHLDGQRAMEAVRYRHDNDPYVNVDYSDVGRAAMQRQVLTQLAKKVVSWNSVTKVKEFVDIFRTYVETDLSATDMVWFATQALQVDVDSAVTQGTLEGDGGSRCRGFSYCFTFKAEDILPVLNEQVNPYDRPLTAADLHLMKPD